MSSNSLFKYIQYYPDGSGRDSYINANSGGFSRFMPKQVISPYYEVIQPRKVASKVKDLSKTSWSFRYKSDGSGRDSYILSGSGGLQHDYQTSKPFGSLLRAGFANDMYEKHKNVFTIIDPRTLNPDDRKSGINQKMNNSQEKLMNDIDKNKTENKLITVRFIGRDEYLRSSRLRKIQNNVTRRLYSSNGERSHGLKDYDNYKANNGYNDVTKNYGNLNNSIKRFSNISTHNNINNCKEKNKILGDEILNNDKINSVADIKATSNRLNNTTQGFFNNNNNSSTTRFNKLGFSSNVIYKPNAVEEEKKINDKIINRKFGADIYRENAKLKEISNHINSSKNTSARKVSFKDNNYNPNVRGNSNIKSNNEFDEIDNNINNTNTNTNANTITKKTNLKSIKNKDINSDNDDKQLKISSSMSDLNNLNNINHIKNKNLNSSINKEGFFKTKNEKIKAYISQLNDYNHKNSKYSNSMNFVFPEIKQSSKK